MQFSNEVTTVTREKIIPKVFDTVTKGSPFLQFLLQNAKEWKSGTNYEAIIKYQGTTNGGNTGIADKLDSNRQNTRTKMSFEPKMANKPIVVANIEMTLNEGDERVLDLLETEFNSQAQELANVMADNLYTGTGTGVSWDSLANAADDATNYATYGTLSRTTYPSIKGYYLAGAGALTLAKLATAFDATTSGQESPDSIITTKSIWSTYESLLTPTVRHNYVTSGYPKMNAFGMITGSAASVGGQAGFDVLFYRGAPVIRDEKVSSGKVFLANSKAFYFAGINLKGKDIKNVNFKSTSDGVPAGVPGNVPMTRGFNFRDLMNPVDQLAEVGYLIYAGNFVCVNPKLTGQMVGAS